MKEISFLFTTSREKQLQKGDRRKCLTQKWYILRILHQQNIHSSFFYTWKNHEKNQEEKSEISCFDEETFELSFVMSCFYDSTTESKI